MLMNSILSRVPDTPIKVSIVGANGQFSRSLLAQIHRLSYISLDVLCDRDVTGLQSRLIGAGYDAAKLEIVTTEAAARAAISAGKIALCDDYPIAVDVASDVFIEATGSPHLGITIVDRAIDRGSNIVMINKEAESITGTALAKKAHAKGLNYVLAHGDQPRNLIELYAWVRLLGFEVVAAGKASEYDFIYDRAANTVSAMEQVTDAGDLADWWDLGDDIATTLQRRSAALRALPQATAPDYGEMSLVVNSTDLRPSKPDFHYPLARITELADIYSLVEDGGVVESSGVVDVFNVLREVDEVSFGGGVFVVVKGNDKSVWEVLASKGHVVSKNLKYGCIFFPFHFMGLETPLSILDAATTKVTPEVAAWPQPKYFVAAYAERDFEVGEVLEVKGSHHSIEGTSARLVSIGEVEVGTIPYYIAGDNRVKQPIARGEMIRAEHMELSDPKLLERWSEVFVGDSV